MLKVFHVTLQQRRGYWLAGILQLVTLLIALPSISLAQPLSPEASLSNRALAEEVARRFPGFSVDAVEADFAAQDRQMAEVGFPIPLAVGGGITRDKPLPEVRPWTDDFKLLGTYTLGTDAVFKPYEEEPSAEERAEEDRLEGNLESTLALYEEEAENLPPLPDCIGSSETVLFFDEEQPANDEGPQDDILLVRGTPPEGAVAQDTAVVSCEISGVNF